MAIDLNKVKTLFGKLAPVGTAKVASLPGNPYKAFDEIGPLGNIITQYYHIPGRVDIDGKPFHYPSGKSPQDILKKNLLDSRTWQGYDPYVDFEETAPVFEYQFPQSQLVDTGGSWRPHANTALGRWFDKTFHDENGFINEQYVERALKMLEGKGLPF